MLDLGVVSEQDLEWGLRASKGVSPAAFEAAIEEVEQACGDARYAGFNDQPGRP
jgi:hypothetical protein